ncbi:MAG: hypothetical protein QXX94_01940 [Candidatus Bathyarchaeia archaeon]
MKRIIGEVQFMCLLKVYVEDEETGDRTLVAGNVALISMDKECIKLLDVNLGEKLLAGMILLSIDALNSTVILREMRKMHLPRSQHSKI